MARDRKDAQSGTKNHGRVQAAGWKETFLAELEKWGIVEHAAKQAGVGRRTVYRHREEDPEFREAWEEAEGKIIATMEVVAHQRALVGTSVPIIFGGKIVGSYQEVDTGLLKWLLAKKKPEVYGDKIDLSLHHTGNVNVEFYLPDNGRDPEEALLARDDPDPAPGR